MSEKMKTIAMVVVGVLLAVAAFGLWRANSAPDPDPSPSTPAVTSPTLPSDGQPTDPEAEPDPEETDTEPELDPEETSTQVFDEEEPLTGAAATLTDSGPAEIAAFEAVSGWLNQPHDESSSARVKRLTPLFAPDSAMPRAARPVPSFGASEMNSVVTGLSWAKLYDAGEDLIGVMVDVQLETVRMIDGVRQIDTSPVVAYVTLTNVDGTWVPLDITT